MPRYQAAPRAVAVLEYRSTQATRFQISSEWRRRALARPQARARTDDATRVTGAPLDREDFARAIAVGDGALRSR